MPHWLPSRPQAITLAFVGSRSWWWTLVRPRLSRSFPTVRSDWFAGGHMPGGLAGMAHDYALMQELTERALHGERWDSQAIDLIAHDPISDKSA